ncbi:MAG: hypothetical protein E6G41_05495 [Actinobacteria bacterium]|nr:MAG: hypothetical protein E6G41_05495 [Actinomycetota bacterium]
MRIRLALLIAVLSAAFAATAASPAAKPKAYFCGAVKTTVLLWPHGHKTLRSFHVPAAHTPNIQVYRYDPNFAGGNLLLYADVRARVKTVKDYCEPGPSVPPSQITDAQTLKGKRAVSCSVGASQTFEVTTTSHGVTVRGREASRTLWIASMTRHGAAKVTYDGSACELGPSP